eukprot:COSAG01_NODE_603_length_14905_cov_12.534648_5_plen_123_part_00
MCVVCHYLGGVTPRLLLWEPGCVLEISSAAAAAEPEPEEGGGGTELPVAVACCTFHHLLAVSHTGGWLGRGGRRSLASASSLDTHRDSVTGRGGRRASRTRRSGRWWTREPAVSILESVHID